MAVFRPFVTICRRGRPCIAAAALVCLFGYLIDSNTVECSKIVKRGTITKSTRPIIDPSSIQWKRFVERAMNVSPAISMGTWKTKWKFRLALGCVPVPTRQYSLEIFNTKALPANSDWLDILGREPDFESGVEACSESGMVGFVYQPQQPMFRPFDKKEAVGEGKRPDETIICAKSKVWRVTVEPEGVQAFRKKRSRKGFKFLRNPDLAKVLGLVSQQKLNMDGSFALDTNLFKEFMGVVLPINIFWKVLSTDNKKRAEGVYTIVVANPRSIGFPLNWTIKVSEFPNGHADVSVYLKDEKAIDQGLLPTVFKYKEWGFVDISFERHFFENVLTDKQVQLFKVTNRGHWTVEIQVKEAEMSELTIDEPRQRSVRPKPRRQR